MNNKHKIAFLHRYGLEGWICCGGHAIPGIVENLSTDTDIHFYGPKTTEEKNPELRSKLQMHELPYTWNRANPNDKITKTLLWYFWLPIIGFRCRLNGTKLIWNDETVPFTAPILRLFFGRNIAITVMDFFARIYTEKHPRLCWLRDLVERIDFAAWRKLPLIFTKVLYTQEFLAKHGVPKESMHLYRNPVDHTKFHPVHEATRTETRKQFGFADSDIVLSHHGILHPNKGNDWILHRVAELKNELPCLKYLLIGNGPEMDSLKQLATKLGITDRVVFTGWLPTEQDLNNALASADIGLVMRIGQETDHFHMTDTLAHEMACGKPILAVNLHGIAEVITDGENGFLFSHEQASEFHARLKQLAENTEICRTFGNKALELSQQLCHVDTCSSALAEAIRAKTKKPSHA
ncbi:MAG: glycosyltransferase [Verrucomicrobiota bacterium]